MFLNRYTVVYKVYKGFLLLNMAVFLSSYGQPQHRLDIVFFLFKHLSLGSVSDCSSAKEPSLTVKRLILTGTSLQRAISLWREQCLFTQRQIFHYRRKAVRGSSLTETEGFVLQDYAICIFLITAQTYKTTWFRVIKGRSWGWLDQDSEFVNLLNYIWS